MKKKPSLTRRKFLTSALKAGVAAALPSIVPASVFGKHAPSNRINIGAIGTGRISRIHDLPGVWKYDQARLIAVCDLDANRVEAAAALINDYYTKKNGRPYDGIQGYHNHQELLLNKDIDAVIISTPDHWHALTAIHAVRAGKDVYLQKPASLTIAEGRIMADTVKKSGRIFQIGSQQRSSTQFRYAAELVRNGRIGDLKTVYVGLPGDPSGDVEPEMAGLYPARILYGKKSPSTDRLRPSWLAALRAIRRGHDHRLGRTSYRFRPLGHGHRIHRPHRSLGPCRFSQERTMGRPWYFPHRSALCQWRSNGRQQRITKRNKI